MICNTPEPFSSDWICTECHVRQAKICTIPVRKPLSKHTGNVAPFVPTLRRQEATLSEETFDKENADPQTHTQHH